MVYEKYEIDVLSPSYNDLYLRLLCEGKDLAGAVDYDQLSQLRGAHNTSLTPTLSSSTSGSVPSKHTMTRRNTLPLSRKPALNLKSKSVSEQHIVKSHEMAELSAVSSSMKGQTQGVLSGEKQTSKERGGDPDILDFDMIPEDLEETDHVSVPPAQEGTFTVLRNETESHLSSETRSINDESDSVSCKCRVC